MYHDIGIMQVPNYLHHSKKAQKPTKKPQALRAAKKRAKMLIKKLRSQSWPHYTATTVPTLMTAETFALWHQMT